MAALQKSFSFAMYKQSDSVYSRGSWIRNVPVNGIL